MNNSDPISAVAELNQKLNTIIDTVMQSKEEEVLELYSSFMIKNKDINDTDLTIKINEFIVKETYSVLLPVKVDYDVILKPISSGSKMSFEEALFIATTVAQLFSTEKDNTWNLLTAQQRSAWADASCIINDLYFKSPGDAVKVMTSVSKSIKQLCTGLAN